MTARPFPAAAILATLLIAGPSFAEEAPRDATAETLLKRIEDDLRVDRPSFQDVRDQADTVVIGHHLADEPAPEDVRPAGFSEEKHVAIVSKLEVAATSAGNAKPGPIDIVHVRWKKPIVNLSARELATFRSELDVPFGVTVVEIDGQPRITQQSLSVERVRPDYLVFLKRREDGRFELATGSDDNGAASVRRLAERADR